MSFDWSESLTEDFNEPIEVLFACYDPDLLGDWCTFAQDSESFKV